MSGDVVPVGRLPHNAKSADGRFLKGHAGGPGIPTTYTEAMGQRIADLLATTSRGMQWLCENIPGLPKYSTVITWEQRYQDFAKLTAQARRIQAMTLVDECMEIADDTAHDHIMVFVKGEPREVIDLAAVARAKIRIDTRIKLAKMFDPTRFGDRLDISARVGGFASQDDVIDELE